MWLVAEGPDSAAAGHILSAGNGCSQFSHLLVYQVLWVTWRPLLKPQWSAIRGHRHWIYSLATQAGSWKVVCATTPSWQRNKPCGLSFSPTGTWYCFSCTILAGFENTRGSVVTRRDGDDHTHPADEGTMLDWGNPACLYQSCSLTKGPWARSHQRGQWHLKQLCQVSGCK